MQPDTWQPLCHRERLHLPGSHWLRPEHEGHGRRQSHKSSVAFLLPLTSSWLLGVPGKLINNLSCLGFAVVLIT